jgi:hypothetical protein
MSAYSWDIFFGGKGGIGFGGAVLEVSLAELSPRDFSTSISRQDRRGRLVGFGVFDANFISPTNFGFEIEAGYRLGGERIYDINEKRHSLRLHYLDFSAIGNYWFFGKLISAGFGFTLSYLAKAEILDIDITYNFKRIDLSAIIRIGFNYWALSEKMVLSAELRFLMGLTNILNSEGKFNNVGIYFCFGIHFIHKTVGERIIDLRY